MVKIKGFKTRNRLAAGATKAIVKKQRKPSTQEVKLSPVMKQLVQKEIKGGREIKYANNENNGTIVFNGFSPVMGVNNLQSLIPRIQQGDDSTGMRIGNRIKPISLYLDLFIRLPAARVTDLDRCAIEIRAIVGSNKARMSYPVLYADPNDTFFNLLRRGDEPTPYNAGQLDANLPINTKYITGHHDKTIKLITQTNDAKTYGVQGHFRKYTMKVPLPKTLKYLEDTDQFPCNAAPWLAIGFQYLNGAAGVPVNVPEYWYRTRFTFEDA